MARVCSVNATTPTPTPTPTDDSKLLGRLVELAFWKEFRKRKFRSKRGRNLLLLVVEEKGWLTCEWGTLSRQIWAI